ncbi:MAG: FliI/YscN family ATPase [Candidatus Krumholzibacteriota bacterium]|nr:FliI/YscN family ATPase [Candidatus Krumholzibacteriota bacterium]
MQVRSPKKWDRLRSAILDTNPVQASGRVVGMIGMVTEVEGVRASVGDICAIETGRHSEPLVAEVVGFRQDKLLLMPFNSTSGVGKGSVVFPSGKPLTIPVGEQLLGRVMGALGEELDGKGPILSAHWKTLDNLAPSPLERRPINTMLETGVKAVDAILPCGMGQRMGIFSGSGVGKSVLLGMICRNAISDVNVIALIGERGREVREFVDNILGKKGMSKSVVVAVTSDRSPVLRVKGAEAAMTIAEYFRDQGLNVLFMMDSVTRYAMAQREIGLAVGEPPTARGYTPSVFAKLPALLERAGNGSRGSITGFYSVLVEGDDISADPLTDAIRAILDGHIVLSRRLANANLYPAVDILESISRLAPVFLTADRKARRERILKWYTDYREAEDLINIGAYEKGSNPDIDIAVTMCKELREFFRQDLLESSSFENTSTSLAGLIAAVGSRS